ncbi:MAG: DUF6508 domain-containing protein [Bacteroidota bacterium]|nr:DUF6508 domain-containing protein [Bacteroidota bacterium]
MTELEEFEKQIYKLTLNDWKELFVLIPVIESSKEFIRSGGIIEDENDPDNFKITPIIESKIVLDFEKIMYKLKLVIPFNWTEWDEGREIVNKGNYTNLDTITLLKILTAFIRNNRFCDGALAGRFKDRSIEIILNEIKKNIEQ